MNRREVLFRPWRDLGQWDDRFAYPPINRWAITGRPLRDLAQGGLGFDDDYDHLFAEHDYEHEGEWFNTEITELTEKQQERTEGGICERAAGH